MSISGLRQRGFSLIEVLVVTVILAAAALAITNSTVQSLMATKRMIRSSAAIQLAASRIEELSIPDPLLLSAADSGTESGLTVDGIAYSRQTEIVVNADASRTISVTVAPDEPSLGPTVTLTDIIALRGNT